MTEYFKDFQLFPRESFVLEKEANQKIREMYLRPGAPRNPQFTFRSVKNVDQRANKMYAVVWVCFLLSTILSIVLFVCYKKQVIINIRDFAIAVLALNTLLFAVSIVCMCCYRGLGNVLKSRAFIILVLLVLEIGDIALSVYTYLKI